MSAKSRTCALVLEAISRMSAVFPIRSMIPFLKYRASPVCSHHPSSDDITRTWSNAVSSCRMIVFLPPAYGHSSKQKPRSPGAARSRTDGIIVVRQAQSSIGWICQQQKPGPGFNKEGGLELKQRIAPDVAECTAARIDAGVASHKDVVPGVPDHQCSLFAGADVAYQGEEIGWIWLSQVGVAGAANRSGMQLRDMVDGFRNVAAHIDKRSIEVQQIEVEHEHFP